MGDVIEVILAVLRTFPDQANVTFKNSEAQATQLVPDVLEKVKAVLLMPSTPAETKDMLIGLCRTLKQMPSITETVVAHLSGLPPYLQKTIEE